VDKGRGHLGLMVKLRLNLPGAGLQVERQRVNRVGRKLVSNLVNNEAGQAINRHPLRRN